MSEKFSQNSQEKAKEMPKKKEKSGKKKSNNVPRTTKYSEETDSPKNMRQQHKAAVKQVPKFYFKLI